MMPSMETDHLKAQLAIAEQQLTATMADVRRLGADLNFCRVSGARKDQMITELNAQIAELNVKFDDARLNNEALEQLNDSLRVTNDSLNKRLILESMREPVLEEAPVKVGIRGDHS